MFKNRIVFGKKYLVITMIFSFIVLFFGFYMLLHYRIIVQTKRIDEDNNVEFDRKTNLLNVNLNLKGFYEKSNSDHCMLVVSVDNYEPFWNPFLYLYVIHVGKFLPSIPLYFFSEEKDVESAVEIKKKYPYLNFVKTGFGSWFERHIIAVQKTIELGCKYVYVFEEDHLIKKDVKPDIFLSLFNSIKYYNLDTLRVCKSYKDYSLRLFERCLIGNSFSYDSSIDKSFLLFWFGCITRMPYTNQCQMWNIKFLLKYLFEVMDANKNIKESIREAREFEKYSRNRYVELKLENNDNKKYRSAFSQDNAIIFSHGSRQCVQMGWSSRYVMLNRHEKIHKRISPENFDINKCPQLEKAKYNRTKLLLM